MNVMDLGTSGVDKIKYLNIMIAGAKQYIPSIFMFALSNIKNVSLYLNKEVDITWNMKPFKACIGVNASVRY